MSAAEGKVARARDLFLEGYNCAQAVFAAFAPDYGMDEKQALRLSSAMGGGMGGMRETCGAVSAMAMVLGLREGYDQPDLEAKKRLYDRAQALAGRFRQEHGTLSCRELLAQNGVEAAATPSARTPEYYKKRPCVRYVEYCARLLAGELAE